MVERILTRHGSAILKPMRATFASWRVAFRLCCSRSSRLCVSRAAVSSAIPSGRSGALRPKTPASPASRSPCPTPSSQAAEIDGPGICGMTRPLKVSALANGTIAVDKTLTIDCPMIPALEALARRHRRARRSDPVRAEGGDRQSVRRLQLPGHRQLCPARGSPSTPSAMRSTWRASRSPTAGRSTSSATGRQPTLRKPPSCTRSTRAPASISPPSWAPARTCSITTTSTSISPITARPTRVPGASASRRRRPTSCRAPAAPDGLPPAPEIEEPLDIAHLSAPGALAPDAAPVSRTPRPGRAMDPTAPCRRPRSARSSQAADPAGRGLSRRRHAAHVVDPRPLAAPPTHPRSPKRSPGAMVRGVK